MPRVTCTNCGAILEAPDERLGRRATCPKCRQSFQLPALADRALNVRPPPPPTRPKATSVPPSTRPHAPDQPDSVPSRHSSWNVNKVLLLGLGLMVLLPIGLLVGWLVLATAISGSTRRTVSTVTSKADALRRLELRGYSCAKESNALGQEIVRYERKTSNAEFGAEIVRWSGGQRIVSLIFSCRTNEEAFNSEQSRDRLWDQLESDVCAMVNARQDYLRALAGMKKVNDSGLPRYEGRATTSGGWQLHVIEYVGYGKLQVRGEADDLAMALIEVNHLETAEQIPASAILEFNRQFENAKED